MKKWNPPESCFVFDRKRPAGGKRLFLYTFCFYFMVAGFIYFSLLPEVNNLCSTPVSQYGMHSMAMIDRTHAPPLMRATGHATCVD